MDNTTTYIDINNLSDTVNYWDSVINSFDSNLPTTTNTTSNGFTLIKDAGFGVDSLNQYDADVRELSNYLREYYQVINKYLDKMESADNYINNNMPSISTTEKKKAANTTIEVDDKVSTIRTSNMSDLRTEASILNNKRVNMQQEYNSNYNINKTNMNSILKDTKQTIDYKEDATELKKTNLTNINKDSQKSVGVSSEPSIYGSKTNLNSIKKEYNYSSNENTKSTINDFYNSMIKANAATILNNINNKKESSKDEYKQ